MVLTSFVAARLLNVTTKSYADNRFGPIARLGKMFRVYPRKRMSIRGEHLWLRGKTRDDKNTDKPVFKVESNSESHSSQK
jgi:hypothetical protein